MALVRVGQLSELPPGQVSEVCLGQDTYLICNHEGIVHCLSGICPHAGGPLGQGGMHGEMIVCPWHGWEFNCLTGANDQDEDLLVEKFQTVVDAGEIYIDIPQS